MGEPVGSQFWQMVRKFKTVKLYSIKSVPFTEKRPGKLETSIKYRFQQMLNKFPFEKFRPEKTGLPFQMLRCSRKFSTRTTRKTVFYFPFGQIFQDAFKMV